MDKSEWNSFPSNMFHFSAGLPADGYQLGHIDSPSLSLKKRAARIMKTNSAGSSPHTIGRRKTTAVHGSSRQRYPLHHHHANASESNVSVLATSRPFSWHPSSFAASHTRNSASMPQQNVNMNMQLPETHFTTASVNGIITPLSYPCPDEPLPAELFSTLDGYQHGWLGANSFEGCDGSSTLMTAGSSWQQQGMTGASLTSHNVPQNQLPNTLQYMNDLSHVYGQQTMPQFTICQPPSTTPPTPDFLPIQNFSGEPESGPVLIAQKDQAPKDELIGMGLYDAPDDTLFSDTSLEDYMYLTRLDGASVPLRPLGKGLKLEETFQPSEMPDEEEEDDEDEDAEYMSDTSPQEVQKALVMQEYQPQTIATAPNLSNHTFFFENDDSSSHGGVYASSLHPGSQWVASGSAPYGWI